MGQLSAYRFPESSGWEKVWSWTNEEGFKQSQPKFIELPTAIRDYDILLVLPKGFMWTYASGQYGSSQNLTMYFTTEQNTNHTSTNKVITISNVNQIDTKINQLLNFGFSFIVLKDNITVFSVNDSTGELVSRAIHRVNINDLNYLALKAFASAEIVGGTIDFYGMNLPK